MFYRRILPEFWGCFCYFVDRKTVGIFGFREGSSQMATMLYGGEAMEGLDRITMTPGVMGGK